VSRLAIVGATASGKSDLAMAFALEHGGAEIVAVDAMQVYRRMDIGTAKPTLADRAAVRHHCIDVVEPSADYTVAQYQDLARDALSEIDGRGHDAVLVAGTGLYLTAIVDHLDIPGQWPAIRTELEHVAAGPTGVTGLHERLAALDPVAAHRMEPTNVRRVVRALEVCLGSGRPFSSFGPGVEAFPTTDVVMVGLRWDRAARAERIRSRIEQMLADGLLDEARALHAEDPPLSRTARQALGYRELFAHFDGQLALRDAVELIVTRTRQFATRQDRWFRRDPRIRWIDIEVDPRLALPALRSLVG
jgi:tRNA dimethylallyltransferase